MTHSDCDIADTRRYDEPDLTATHFWLRLDWLQCIRQSDEGRMT